MSEIVTGTTSSAELVADIVAAFRRGYPPEAPMHRESPLFEADRGTYWKSLRALGRVVQINPVINPAYQGYYISSSADGAADPHQAAPDRPGIAFTYVTDGGLTSPLELKRYRLFHARLGSISSEPFAREKQK